MPKQKPIINPKGRVNITKKTVLDNYKEIELNIRSNTTNDLVYNSFFQQFEDTDVQAFVPTIFMARLKETFYKNGGKETKAYTSKEYAELMEVPESVIKNIADKDLTFFKWVHDNRNFKEEVNSIILIMVREMYNAFMQTTSARDKSQILATLSRFSSLTDPPKSLEDATGKEVDELQTPEEVIEELKKMGYVPEENGSVTEEELPEIEPVEEEGEIDEEVSEDTEQSEGSGTGSDGFKW